MRVCPSCGRENEEDARFCSGCATPLEPAAPVREERKVVTCLFCDLVGFTARAERMDPEDVRRLLQPYHTRLRAELERHGGTVEKFIGDAVMAVFGAPTAHEDDPERAVRAALVIRDALGEEGELEVRIGITTGEALIALGARPEAGEGMVAGDIVNTAARIQAAAPVGRVLVDETTYHATERAIEYGETPPIEAKGKTAPVPVWEALRARARVGVERVGGAALVGRDHELTLLRETLTRVKREKSIQLVTLVGVPGIGKSRLVYELFAGVEENPEIVFWRRGRSLPYGEGVTFWALSEMVKAQAGILESDSSDQAGNKLHEAVERYVSDPTEASWVERHLRPLAGLEAVETSPGDHRGEAFAAWRRFFEALAEERPLVLVFEDLHWADDALLDFVDHLVDWASGVPILALCTARPELLVRRSGWGGGKVNSSTIRLSPLSDDETATLVHSLVGRSVLAADVQKRLLERAGGNPLYAEEFTRMLTERPSEVALPESVQGIIAARLDTLPSEEKELIQNAAVMGRTFWLGALGQDKVELEERLHSLERKEFVSRERRTSVAGEPEYAFRHALVRDVAYEQIPRAQRVDKHRMAAEWIEGLGRPDDHAEMLAHHYVAALDYARAAGQETGLFAERGRAALREAGDRAFALNAFAATGRFYFHALELSQHDDAGRPELLFRLGRALHLTADERAEQLLEDASRELVVAGRTERAAEAHALLSEFWWDQGKRDRSFQQLERARELLGAHESEGKARVLARLARGQMIENEHERAIRAGREALAIAERLGLDDVRSHVLNSLGSARFQLGDPHGIADIERSLEIALAAGSHLASISYNNLGYMHFIAGDVRRDRELREEGRRLAARFGDERMLRFLRGVAPVLEFYSGSWEEALRQADAFIAECEAGSPHILETAVRWPRALICLARDDAEGAEADALRAEELAREAKGPQQLLPGLAARLRVESELSRLDRAAVLADELLSAAPDHAICPPAIELAWAAERLQILDAVRDWVGAIAYRSTWSDAALAILDDELGRAAELFARIGSVPDEARARLCAGDPENVRRALDFYRSVGATRYIRECDALLAEAS